MAPEIDQAVFSWSNFLLQLFRRQIPEQFLRSLHIRLPPAQRGVNERLLRSHSSPSFYLNESRVVSHVSAALSIRPALCRLTRGVNAEASSTLNARDRAVENNRATIIQ